MATVETSEEMKARRPLSPHLSIFSPLINMVMSIFHRITGATLYFGSLLLAAWLISTATGGAAFDNVNAVFGSIPGRILLFGYTWVLIHHMLGGIRHLLWDTAHGLDLPTVKGLSWGTLVGSVTLTLVLWGAALGFAGTSPIR